MPIRPTATEHEEAMRRGGSDWKFISAREELGEEILGKLFHVGVMTLLLSAVYGVEDLHAR